MNRHRITTGVGARTERADPQLVEDVREARQGYGFVAPGEGFEAHDEDCGCRRCEAAHREWERNQ